MQITKTTEDRVERSVVPFKEQVKEFPAKMGKFFTSNKKRAMIIAASVFVIVAAIMLLSYFTAGSIHDWYANRKDRHYVTVRRNREEVA